eukprot:SAG22_NODE_468_length_10147_cov_77.238654_4_plen_184_part_00
MPFLAVYLSLQYADVLIDGHMVSCLSEAVRPGIDGSSCCCSSCHVLPPPLTGAVPQADAPRAGRGPQVTAHCGFETVRAAQGSAFRKGRWYYEVVIGDDECCVQIGFGTAGFRSAVTCRLPLAACRLPLAACRLPLAWRSHRVAHAVPSRPVPSRPVPSRPVPSRPIPSRPALQRQFVDRRGR